jgi:probable HAF family extracellular repeat protein
MEDPMRRISCALSIAAVFACSQEPELTQPLDAHLQPAPGAEYRVIKLSTLGGAVTVGTSLNNRGWVAGFADRPDLTRHATLWRGGTLTELGTLGGANSNVQWPGLNDRGMVVGISQTAVPDTLGEEWSCDAFIPATDNTCLGFVWDGGVMKPLPTLGGDNGFATSVNNRGQVVGWAETPVLDPTCNAPQVLQFRAVMWEPRKDTMRELPPFPGDSTSAATGINNRGQAVGISGECDVAVGRFSARHAVLWENGMVTDIGNLGGVSWHTPMDVSERGDIVGFSNPPGDENGEFIAHAFLWTREDGISDLELFDGDDFSQAFGINGQRQVVGRSCGPNGCRAVLWHDGEMTDLNALAQLEEGDVLRNARHINEAGVITGEIFDASTGNTVAYVAKPRGR